MSEKHIYNHERGEMLHYILHTAHPKKTIDFYRQLGINFVRDESNFFVKYVARPSVCCFFELYFAGDSVADKSVVTLTVDDLESKMSQFGSLAQKQADEGYALVDPDSRVLRVYDSSKFKLKRA